MSGTHQQNEQGPARHLLLQLALYKFVCSLVSRQQVHPSAVARRSTTIQLRLQTLYTSAPAVLRHPGWHKSVLQI